VWHNQGVSVQAPEDDHRKRARRAPRPLDPERLSELALRYVSRFATTRAKVRDYLGRKLRERGWEGEEAPAVEALVTKLAELGYVDDAAFARAKGQALTGRGYGVRRVSQALTQAGVAAGDGEEARTAAEQDAVEAALRFARRKRIGPFAGERADPKARERSLAAMLRAGHGFALARAIVDAAPDQELDPAYFSDFRS